MLFERIESKGLAHYSYLIGNQQQAVVIDPRRDVDIYIEKATQEGMRIATVLCDEAREIEKGGLPVLRIDTDYSQSDMGQLRTRVEAFIEQIQIQK